MGPGGSPIASIGQGPVLAGPIPVQERTFCPRRPAVLWKPVFGRASKRSSRAALDEAVVFDSGWSLQGRLYGATGAFEDASGSGKPVEKRGFLKVPVCATVPAPTAERLCAEAGG